MPMYFDQKELELEAVEERGADRVPQEMAKSGGGGINPPRESLPPELVEHKMKKTEAAVGTRVTQVLRRERED